MHTTGKLIMIVVFVASLSCSLFVPEAIQTPASTETPVSTPDVDSEFSARTEAITDREGEATLIDPVTQESKPIKVVSYTSGEGLRSMKIFYHSDGFESILFALDSSGRYLPELVDSRIKFPSLYPQGDDKLVVSLKTITDFQSPNDIASVYPENPDLTYWGWDFDESCDFGHLLEAEPSEFVFLPPQWEDISHAESASAAILSMLRGYYSEPSTEILDNLPESQGVLLLRRYDAPIPVLQPVGWCLEPLDPTSVQSIVDWVDYGLRNSLTDPFAQLFPESGGIFYANAIEGGQPVGRQEFLADLAERLPGRAQCDGYFFNNQTLQIWTSNWSPPFRITELCYDSCNPVVPPWESAVAAFIYHLEGNKWKLRSVWVNQPNEFILDPDDGLMDCN